MSDMKTVIKCTGVLGPSHGSEPIAIDVVDGKAIRSRPIRYEDYATTGLNRWCIRARGKELWAPEKSVPGYFGIAWKNRTYSPNRIMYPLKRVDWDPDGERHPENRGISKYERISWDEATDIIAKEIMRVKEQYGMYSILVESDGHCPVKSVHGQRGNEGVLLDILGGCTLQARNPDSWEGWYWGGKHMWGMDPVGEGFQNNLWRDVALNSDMVLYWGCDVLTTPLGYGGLNPSRYCFFLRDIGVEQWFVAPDINYGAAVHCDKWFPVYPNTDSALQLAIAHTWIKEGTYDREYVDTHSVGFDWFEWHVMGGDDGIEKTPEWAESVCGLPARRIKALARHWAKRNVTIGHGNGGSFIRSFYSHEPARLEIALLTMQALGKPGRNQMKMLEFLCFNLDSMNPTPRPKFAPQLDEIIKPYRAPGRPSIVTEVLIPEALSGPYDSDHPLTWFGCTVSGVPAADQFEQRRYPAEGAERIHMIWTDSPKWTTSWNGGNYYINAVRNPIIETMIAQQPWMEDDCLLADIILPISTKYEEKDIITDNGSGIYCGIFLEEQAVDKVGEGISDWEVACRVAKKLGDDVFDAFCTDGTPDDVDPIIEKGFNTSGAQWYMTYDDFVEKKGFVVPTAEGWEEDAPGFLPFCLDPENNPLSTPSGLIEFYSNALADHFPDDPERTPYPHWIEKGPTHPDERLTTSPRGKLYPFIMVSNHPHFRMHCQFDDAAWIREIQGCKVTGPDGYGYEPVWVNPIDAEELGLVSGDIVKIYNDRGWTMGGVIVTNRINRHTVLQDHGARLDPIEIGVSDRAGNNNTIAPKAVASANCCGEVTSGYLVGLEKVDVFELAKQYPKTFNRAYDPETGPLYFQDCLA